MVPREGGDRQRPENGQHGDWDQKHQHDIRDPARHRKGADQELSLKALRPRGRRLGLTQRRPRQLGQRDKAKAAPLQTRHQASQRGHGLPAIPAAVVEEHHAAPPPGRRRVTNDPGDTGPPPVLGVVIGEGDQVARIDRRGQLRRRRAGDRLRAARVGRAKEPRANAGRADDRGIGHRHLQVSLPAGRRGQVDVVEGVGAELESLVFEARHDVGIPDHALADHEEGSRHLQPLEGSRDPRRPARIRPVVEGQGDAPSHRSLARSEPVALAPPDRRGPPERGV